MSNAALTDRSARLARAEKAIAKSAGPKQHHHGANIKTMILNVPDEMEKQIPAAKKEKIDKILNQKVKISSDKEPKSGNVQRQQTNAVRRDIKSSVLGTSSNEDSDLPPLSDELKSKLKRAGKVLSNPNLAGSTNPADSTKTKSKGDNMVTSFMKSITKSHDELSISSSKPRAIVKPVAKSPPAPPTYKRRGTIKMALAG